MIPVSTILRKEIRQYLQSKPLNIINKEIEQLSRTELQIIFIRYFDKRIPSWVYRECLYYITKLNIPAKDFLDYYMDLESYKDYIPEQFEVFITSTRKERGSFRRAKFYKIKFGIHWKKYFKKAKIKHNAYNVEAVAERLGVSLNEAKLIVSNRKHLTAGNWDNFLKRAGGDMIEARHKFNEFRRKSKHTEESFKAKYGDDDYLPKWKNYLKSKNSYNLDDYIKKYGSINGPIELEKRIQRSVVNYDKYVEIYGKTNAPREYHAYCRRKTKRWRKLSWGKSKESLKLFKPIMHWLDANNIKYRIAFNGGDEKSLFDNKLHKVYYYDFCVQQAKVLIEFDGGTHPSPFLSKSQLAKWRCFLSGLSAKTRLENDHRKKETAIEYGYSFKRIHIEEFNKDPKYWIHFVKHFIQRNLDTFT